MSRAEEVYKRASIRWDLNDPEIAIALLDEAVESAREDVWILWLRGEIHHATGHSVEAVDDYRRALRFEEIPAIYSALGTALEDAGDLPGAIEAYEAAIAIDEDDDDASVALKRLKRKLRA